MRDERVYSIYIHSNMVKKSERESNVEYIILLQYVVGYALISWWLLYFKSFFHLCDDVLFSSAYKEYALMLMNATGGGWLQFNNITGIIV